MLFILTLLKTQQFCICDGFIRNAAENSYAFILVCRRLSILITLVPHRLLTRDMIYSNMCPNVEI